MPVNNNFADSILLNGTSGTVTGNNLGATSEAGEPSQSGAIESSWWSWTANENGRILIDTNGSDYDTYLSVFTGDSVDNLTTLAQNDDGGNGLQSFMALNVTAGTTYHIAVDGFASNEGNIVLNYDSTPPVNDNFEDSISLAGTSGTVTGENILATAEVGEPNQSGAIESSWWNWTATFDGSITIDTNGSDYDTYLSVFTGDSVDNLTTIAQNDDGGDGLDSLVTLDVTAGTTYHIAVDGYSSREGNVVLNYNQDTFVGTHNADLIRGNSSANEIRGLSGNDTIFGSDGNDYLDGGSGDDSLDGNVGDDVLDGGHGHDVLNGNRGNDTLNGGTGIDTLNGGNGDDVLDGGHEHDLLNGNRGNDTLYGGSGIDTLNGGSGHDLLDGGFEHDLLNGGNGNDTLLGGAGEDTLYGNIGDDLISGNEGHDVLDGGNGNDTLNGGTGIDTLIGGTGNDVLDGGHEHDSLNGGDGHDTLLGGTGIDTLNGGAGNDVLQGDAGRDQLFGNGGADTFILQSAMGVDTIYDFELGEDILQLDESVMGTVSLREQGSNTIVEENHTAIAILNGIQDATFENLGLAQS